MEKDSPVIRTIKWYGVIVGIINLISGFFYILIYLMVSIFTTEEFPQIIASLDERILIIEFVLIFSGANQLMLSFNSKNFLNQKYVYFIFVIYSLIIPIILLFGLWPFTVINSFFNLVYGLLIGSLIFKMRNNIVINKYSLN